MIRQCIHRLPLPAFAPSAPPDSRRGSGAVQYLNTKPLVHGLAGAGVELFYDLPSRLADRLAAGDLDVALIPSIELFRGNPRRQDRLRRLHRLPRPGHEREAVFRTPPERVRSLAVDEGSRTSAALARILLAERFGLSPRVEPLPIGAGRPTHAADAVLLIGDRALGHATPGGVVSADLGSGR